MAPGLTDARRYELMGMLKAGLTFKEVMEATGVAKSTLQRLVKKSEETGGDLSRRGGRRSGT